MNLTNYIKKHKENLPAILTIIGFFLFISIPKPAFFKSPIFMIIIVGYYFYDLIKSLFYKINYRRKDNNAINFSTSNDEYYKLSILILGILIIIISIIAFVYDFMDYWPFVAAAFGLLMVLNGYYFVPIGKIQFDENDVIIETQYSRNNRFPIKEIKELAFRNQSILVTNRYEEKKSFSNLNISQQELLAISNYLNLQAPQIESSIKYSDI